MSRYRDQAAASQLLSPIFYAAIRLPMLASLFGEQWCMVVQRTGLKVLEFGAGAGAGTVLRRGILSR